MIIYRSVVKRGSEIHQTWIQTLPALGFGADCWVSLMFSVLICKTDTTRVALKKNKIGFLTLGIIDILGRIILCSGSCPVHCRVLSTISGLYPLDANNTSPYPPTPVLTTTNVSLHSNCLLGSIVPPLSPNWNSLPCYYENSIEWSIQSSQKLLSRYYIVGAQQIVVVTVIIKL